MLLVCGKNNHGGKYIKFEDFCEYILPYRVAFEPLSEWRETYAEAAEQILDSLFIGSDVLQAYKLINENIIMKPDWFLPYVHQVWDCLI